MKTLVLILSAAGVELYFLNELRSDENADPCGYEPTLDVAIGKMRDRYRLQVIDGTFAVGGLYLVVDDPDDPRGWRLESAGSMPERRPHGYIPAFSLN